MEFRPASRATLADGFYRNAGWLVNSMKIGSLRPGLTSTVNPLVS